jgi:hypothetical protein
MKQSRSKQSFALAALVAGGLLTHGAFAQVNVQRVDADTLRVTEFQGKPPHRRQFINQSGHPELYAQYEARLDARPVALTGAETSRNGAPRQDHLVERAHQQLAAGNHRVRALRGNRRTREEGCAPLVRRSQQGHSRQISRKTPSPKRKQEAVASSEC